MHRAIIITVLFSLLGLALGAPARAEPTTFSLECVVSSALDASPEYVHRISALAMI